MLNKITEPQALYQKAPTAGDLVTPAHSNFTSPPKKSSKVNWKIASSIIAASLIAVVGIAGVLIAQRQQQVEGPVAPNAPESIPQAATGLGCTLSFEVTAPPTPTPVPGAAKCISKTATLAGSTVPLTSTSKVKPGEVVEYTITVGATGNNTTSIVISDTLPPELQYVSNSATLNGSNVPRTLTPSITNRILSYDLSGPAANRQNVVKYRATLKTGLAATTTSFTNAVAVVSNPNSANTSTDSSCRLTIGIAPPISGTATCLSKNAFKADGITPFGTATTALAKRGEVITYKILVRANAETTPNVEIKDVLPAALTYVSGSARIGTRQPTATEFSVTGQTLSFKPGAMATGPTQQVNRELVFTYQATVKTDAAVAPFNNTVTVTNNGVAAANHIFCQSTLQVAPIGVAACQAKEAFTDYAGTKIANDADVQPGTTFAYKLTVTATEQTAGEVVVVDTLPATLEFVESRNNTLQHSNGKLTATLPAFGATVADRTKVFEYKVKVKETAVSGMFENQVSVTTAGNTAQADSCKLTLHVPYKCDATCTTDAQCQKVNAGYICSAEAGNKCRRASNPESASCSSTSTEYTCNSSCTSNSQCQEKDNNYICAKTNEGDRCRHKDYPTRVSCDAPRTSTPTPTPTIGCNVGCVSNADCTNPSHICYNDGSGTQVCRLETNPTSPSCTLPGTPTVATTPGQPQLPEELPQTGPEDWVNWLKAGLITLGIGAALLLLL